LACLGILGYILMIIAYALVMKQHNDLASFLMFFGYLLAMLEQIVFEVANGIFLINSFYHAIYA
jgi:uncharacterized membrane protein